MRFLALTIAGSAALFGANADAQTPSATEEIFGSWKFLCPSAEAPCRSFLSIADAETGQVQLTWTFLYDGKTDQLSAVINVPLGVALQPGLRVIDANETAHIEVPFQVCDGTGCRAVAANIGATQIDGLSTGDSVNVQFVPYGHNYLASFAVPTSGLKSAVEALKTSVARVDE